MEQRTSCQDHGAARRAHRRDHRAHRVCVREGQAAFGKAIEVRRFDMRIAQCGDAIRTKIIGKNEKNVGFGRIGCQQASGKK